MKTFWLFQVQALALGLVVFIALAVPTVSPFSWGLVAFVGANVMWVLALRASSRLLP